MTRREHGAPRSALDAPSGRWVQERGEWVGGSHSALTSSGTFQEDELVVRDLLSAAAEHVLLRGDDRLPAPAATVRPLLTLLCIAACQAHTGREPSLAGLPPAAPLRRLVDLLRSEVLQARSAADIPKDRILDSVYALDRVSAALEGDDAVRFTEFLAGGEGLDLLVEVAHDLRSPLGSILFLAEALRRGHSGPINTVQERQLGLVYSAAFGLSSLASDLMELARGGDRLVEAQPVSFSVASIFRSVRDIVQPMAEEKGLEIRLSPPEADFRVGQPSALNRVLLNLTTNSLKFTSEGHVEVSARQLTRTQLEFSVRDTGRGIPAAVMSSLFDPFRKREHGKDYLFSSAGLGLAICRKLVTAMGGDLEVETATDAGTRFHFTIDLPIASRL